MAAAALMVLARPAAATDAAITDAMLSAGQGAQVPSALIASTLSPVLQLSWMQNVARNIRISVLKARITAQQEILRQERAKLDALRARHNQNKARRAGVPVSQADIDRVNKDLEKAGIGQAKGATPIEIKGGVRIKRNEVRFHERRLQELEKELQELEAPSTRSRTTSQAVPLSFAAASSGFAALSSNTARKQGLSLNGSAVRKVGLSGEAADEDPPVHLLSGVNHARYDQNGTANRKGHATSIWSGLHFALTDAQAAGVYGTYRGGRDRLSTFNSSLKSDRFGVGAYFTSALGDTLVGALRFEYNGGDHDITIANTTGTFNTNEFTVQGEIGGRFDLGPRSDGSGDLLSFTWIEPSASVSYSHIDRDAYTLSNGFNVVSGGLNRARLTSGPRLGKTVVGEGEDINLIEPYIHAQGIWDFVNENGFLVAAGTTVKTPDIGGLVGGGLVMSLKNNAILKVESNYAFFEDNFDAWSISGTASVPLASLGVTQAGSAGLLSFQVNAVPASSSASVQLNLPLN